MLLGRGLAALFVIVAASMPVTARAEFVPRVGLGASGTVTINSRAAMRFRASNGSLSPSERARITAERLRQLVAAKIDPNTIYAKGDRWQGRVYSGETMLCIATTADARANRTNPLSLAVSWGSNIKSLLLMPPIVLSETHITVPLGESRRVAVGGAAIGPISAASADSAVAGATVSADGRYVLVMGQAVGDTAVQISVEDEPAEVIVSVR